MGIKIQAVPLNREGDLLFLKNFEQKEGEFSIEYRAMINDVPFKKVPIYPVNEGQQFVITGDDGTIMYRIQTPFLLNLIEDE